MLAQALSKAWWLILLRGIVFILFGVVALANPGATLVVLITLFGAFALVDGLLGIWNAFATRGASDNWWILLIEGFVGVLFGYLALRAPGLTAAVLLLYIAFWAMITGALRVITAIRLRKEIQGEWFLVMSGFASMLFGVLMMLWPGAGALAMLSVIAVWAIVAGAFQVLVAFKVKGAAGKLSAALGKA